jgi:hypothetical protein
VEAPVIFNAAGVSLLPWVLLGTGIAIAAAGTGGAVLGYRYADGRCKAAALERAELVAEVRSANLALADGIATRTEAAIGQIRVQNTTINREVRHEREVHTKVLDNPDCAVPPSTLRLLERARGLGGDDRPAAGDAAGAVPARAAPAGEAPAPAR